MPGLRRGRSSARAAFSRKRLANRAESATLADDELLDLVGLGEQQGVDPLELGVRQPDRDPVIGPDRLDLGPEALGQAALEGERPRRVDAAAEWGQQAQPPVAELVPEPLDHDPPVGRQGASHVALVLEVGDEVLGRQRIEIVALAKPGEDRRPSARAPAEIRLDLGDERAERTAKLDRPTDGVTVPERELAGLPGRGRDDDPVVRDLLDPPRRGTEGDDLTDPALVDHLLVELAHPPSGRARLAG